MNACMNEPITPLLSLVFTPAIERERTPITSCHTLCKLNDYRTAHTRVFTLNIFAVK